MNREQIIRMAREVSENGNWKPALGDEFVVNFMEHFFSAAYAAGAAAEREECAKVCESRALPGTASVAILNGAADAIRARGQE